MPDGMALGRAACEAWTESHKAHHPGCGVVTWDDLGEDDRIDWQRAAMAVWAALPPFGWQA